MRNNEKEIIFAEEEETMNGHQNAESQIDQSDVNLAEEVKKAKSNQDSSSNNTTNSKNSSEKVKTTRLQDINENNVELRQKAIMESWRLEDEMSEMEEKEFKKNCTFIPKTNTKYKSKNIQKKSKKNETSSIQPTKRPIDQEIVYTKPQVHVPREIAMRKSYIEESQKQFTERNFKPKTKRKNKPTKIEILDDNDQAENEFFEKKRQERLKKIEKFEEFYKRQQNSTNNRDKPLDSVDSPLLKQKTSRRNKSVSSKTNSSMVNEKESETKPRNHLFSTSLIKKEYDESTDYEKYLKEKNKSKKKKSTTINDSNVNNRTTNAIKTSDGHVIRPSARLCATIPHIQMESNQVDNRKLCYNKKSRKLAENTPSILLREKTDLAEILSEYRDKDLRRRYRKDD